MKVFRITTEVKSIKTIQYIVEGFGGILWPSRFIGFGIGILIYSVLIYFFFNEGFQIKTLVSLILATFIIIIQIYWK